ncbi:MAG: RNA polymerase sigma factor [Bacteroidales bacterium]|nr:RNA polymerase sigma factor [Bacteroidales bacterium]
MTVKEYNRSVEDFSDSVYRFILGNLKDEDRADDIVQDTWEKLWRNLTEIEYPVVRSWLFKTAYRTMIDIIRKESRMTRIEESDYHDFLSETQYSDLNEILHLALDRLPEHQRSLVLLRDYEGYSYREISEISGMTEAQVKINLYRGRVALRNFIVKIESVI